jgi:hypothetical protein
MLIIVHSGVKGSLLVLWRAVGGVGSAIRSAWRLGAAGVTVAAVARAGEGSLVRARMAAR